MCYVLSQDSMSVRHISIKSSKWFKVTLNDSSGTEAVLWLTSYPSFIRSTCSRLKRFMFCPVGVLFSPLSLVSMNCVHLCFPSPSLHFKVLHITWPWVFTVVRIPNIGEVSSPAPSPNGRRVEDSQKMQSARRAKQLLYILRGPAHILLWQWPATTSPLLWLNKPMYTLAMYLLLLHLIEQLMWVIL